MQERYHDYIIRKMKEERMNENLLNNPSYETKTYDWTDIERAANRFVSMMLTDLWKPDYVVGVIPDGLVLATIIADKIDAELYTIFEGETNCWLAEDAFGTVEDVETYKTRWDHNKRKKILILNGTDNINFFDWLKDDWQGGCFPKETYAWDSIWNNSVRFGAIGKKTGNVLNKNANHSVQYLYDTNERINHTFPWNF